MRSFFAAVVAGAILACSPAAASVIPTKGVGLSPTLAGGGRVVWNEERAGGAVAVRDWVPGRAQRTILTLVPDQPGARSFDVRLAASPAVLLATGYASDRFTRQAAYSETFVQPTGQAAASTGRCAAEPTPIRSVDSWGSAYVYRQCDERGGHVEIRDGNAAPESVGNGGYGARIAGRFVAWIDGPYDPATGARNAVVVFDRSVGAVAYTLPVSDFAGPIRSLDIEPDGKLAVAAEQGRGAGDVRVGWASPQDSSPHMLPLAARGDYDVRIAGGRIAYQRGRASNRSVYDAEIGLTDLKGHARPVARHTDDLLYEESFDYNGTRLAWRELGCRERALVVRESATLDGAGPARPCRLKLLRHPSVRNGIARFRFGCGAFVRPCRFAVSLKAGGRRAGSNGPLRNPVRVKLPRWAYRRLTHNRELTVDATARMLDPAGRQQIRRKRLRLTL